MKKIKLGNLIKLHEELINLQRMRKYVKAIDSERIAEHERKIKEESTQLQTAIDEAQKRCNARTIDANTICMELMQIDEKLGISKHAKKGIKIFCDPSAQKFPNAYKYVPESTHFSAEFNGKEWIVTNIYRHQCKRTKGSIELTDTAKQAIIEHMSII